MPNTNENQSVENAARSAYDTKADGWLTVTETRVTTVEVDVAVIRNSFATKEDVQHIVALLYDHKLASQLAHSVLREDVHAVLARQREEFNAALSKHRDEVTLALAQLRTDLLAGQVEMHKTLIGHIWKLYGFASLLMGGVYFIARYVH
jgi:hypothetical protein